MKRFLLLLLVPLLLLGSAMARAPMRIVTGQAATSTAASLLLIEDRSRVSVLVRNLDATISVYVGATAAVTSSTGMLVKAGECITIYTSAHIYVIAASATPSVAYLTENDQ